MFRRKLYPYEVTLHLNGRHPYLQTHELDYPSRDVVLTIPAKDWNDAEKKALMVEIPNHWSRWVVSIRRADKITNLTIE